MSDPRVIVSIADLTQSIGGVSDIFGGCVGPSAKGPLTITLVSSTKEFMDKYGDPSNTDTNDAYFHYTCMKFLEAAPMYCLRVVSSTAYYAGVHVVKAAASGDSAAIATSETDPDDYTFDSDDTFAIFAANPGTWGNNLKVSVTVEADDQFTIVVQYAKDGSNYETVETWVVSKTQGKKDGFGNNIYLETRINDNSDYIYVVDNTSESTGPKLTVLTSMAEGANGSAVGASQVSTGWDVMTASDKQLDILMAAGWGSDLGGSPSDVSVADDITDCAEAHDGCAILDGNDSSNEDMVVENAGLQQAAATTPRFGEVYSPYLEMLDIVNNKSVYAPPSGFVGAAFALVYTGGNKWDVPAGTTRGKLSGVTNARTVWSSAQRTVLTDGQVNPIKFEKGVGYVIGGDWTLHGSETILQSVGGQQNLTEIVADVKEWLNPFKFDNNTSFTRNRVKSGLDDYFRNRQNAGGLNGEDENGAASNGWAVVCNAGNNTALIRRQHKLIVGVYIRLPRSIRFIYLNITLVDGEIIVSEPTS